MHTSENPITTEYFEYSFDLEKYTVLEDEPNKEKAIVGLLFCANIAPNSLVKFENSDFSSKDCDDYLPFYQQLNLDDLISQEIVSNNALDINDQSLINMAHKKINSHNKSYDIGFFSIVDSGAGVQWISNFDVGYDNEVYNNASGQHPEWTDHLTHKGFDVTSNRCMSVVENYIVDKMDKDSEKVFYVYGHSRGGAVGNLVAKKLIDKGYNTTGYLFAGPNTTTAKDVTDNKYQRIFNYINSKDIITMIPSNKWGFSRYGQIFLFDISEEKDHFKEMNHVSLPSGDLSLIPTALERLADSREKIYTFSDDLLIATSIPLDSEEQIEAFKNSYLDLLSEDSKGFLKSVVTTNDEGKYVVKLIACPALFTSMLSGSITSSFSGESSLDINSPFAQTFIKAARLNTLDLLKLVGMSSFLLYNHYYHSYITYFTL